MPAAAQTSLTIPEAAFITQVAARDIDREIDAGIIRSSGGRGKRALGAPALVYLKTVGELRAELAPSLRKRISKAVAAAIAKGEPAAKIGEFRAPVKEIQRQVLQDVVELERLKRTMVESREEVLGGAPVLKGTRVSVRLIASLVKKGVSEEEIAEELDLSIEQVRAALVYSRIAPPRGRPRIRLRNVTRHVLAD